MLLVHKKKQGHGKWEVSWTWLPYFLAADRELVTFVDQGLTKEFKGTDLSSEIDPDVLTRRMHDRVIALIQEKYPMSGLRQYLEAITYLNAEENDGG